MKASQPLLTLTLCCVFTSFSCKEEKIRTYRVVTENPDEQSAEASPPAQLSGQSIRWKAPSKWQQQTPGQFQTALYELSPQTTVSVSTLKGDGGGVPANVNRWRRQIGLSPVDDVGGESLGVEQPGVSAKWFDLRGESESILAAIITLPAESWFFKLNAPAAETDTRRKEFMQFLTTIEIEAQSPAPSAAPKKQDSKPEISLKAPDGWEKSQGSSMRVASFRIPGNGGPDGDVSVVPLAGEAGSILENVNRWRAQIQLKPLLAETDPAIGSTRESESGPVTITHMVSESALFEGDRKGAISTAILKAGENTWFFKLVGDEKLVSDNREKFEAFVLSAKIP